MAAVKQMESTPTPTPKPPRPIPPPKPAHLFGPPAVVEQYYPPPSPPGRGRELRRKDQYKSRGNRETKRLKPIKIHMAGRNITKEKILHHPVEVEKIVDRVEYRDINHLVYQDRVQYQDSPELLQRMEDLNQWAGKQQQERDIAVQGLVQGKHLSVLKNAARLFGIKRANDRYRNEALSIIQQTTAERDNMASRLSAVNAYAHELDASTQRLKIENLGLAGALDQVNQERGLIRDAFFQSTGENNRLQEDLLGLAADVDDLHQENKSLKGALFDSTGESMDLQKKNDRKRDKIKLLTLKRNGAEELIDAAAEANAEKDRHITELEKKLDEMDGAAQKGNVMNKRQYKQLKRELDLALKAREDSLQSIGSLEHELAALKKQTKDFDPQANARIDKLNALIEELHEKEENERLKGQFYDKENTKNKGRLIEAKETLQDIYLAKESAATGKSTEQLLEEANLRVGLGNAIQPQPVQQAAPLPGLGAFIQKEEPRGRQPARQQIRRSASFTGEQEHNTRIANQADNVVAGRHKEVDKRRRSVSPAPRGGHFALDATSLDEKTYPSRGPAFFAASEKLQGLIES